MCCPLGPCDKTVRSMRICKYCILGKDEDGFYFILDCPLYKFLRVLYLKNKLDSAYNDKVSLTPCRSYTSKYMCHLAMYRRDAGKKNWKVRLLVHQINVLLS